MAWSIASESICMSTTFHSWWRALPPPWGLYLMRSFLWVSVGWPERRGNRIPERRRFFSCRGCRIRRLFFLIPPPAGTRLSLNASPKSTPQNECNTPRGKVLTLAQSLPLDLRMLAHRSPTPKGEKNHELEIAQNILCGCPINCQTGAPLPSFSALVSYARGGTLTEVVNAAAFLPGQVTPGLGVWSHTQADAYKAVWDAFILFDSPGPPFFKRGVQRLMRDIEVHGDQMTFNGSSQFFDTNGNVLAVACASGTGTRIQDAQDED